MFPPSARGALENIYGHCPRDKNAHEIHDRLGKVLAVGMQEIMDPFRQPREGITIEVCGKHPEKPVKAFPHLFWRSHAEKLTPGLV